MVAQNILRTYEAKYVFSERTIRIWRLCRCNQTSQNNWITPYVRKMFWATIYYISTMEYQVFLNINKKNGPDLNVTRTKPHKYQVFVWK